MLTGFNSGVSAIVYNQQKMDAISNNMANTETTGFKRSIYIEQTRQVHPDTNKVDPQVLKRLPKFYGMERSGVFKSFETGPNEVTGNPLDLAIDNRLENAFFKVKKAGDKSQETFYTRNGTLSVGPEDPNDPKSQSILYTSGHILLNESGSSIPIDGSKGPLTIDKEGTITQDGSVLGKIPLYKIEKTAADGTVQDAPLYELLSCGDSLFQLPPESSQIFKEKQIEIVPGQVNELVHQGVREGSNVNNITEMMMMLETSKAVQANVGSMQKQMDSLSKLFQEVRS